MPKKKKEEKPNVLTAKTEHQKRYIRNMAANTVNFATGPAGTGKTHVAMGLAVQMLRHERVDKIILTRPMVSVGRDMGFLPGDIAELNNCHGILDGKMGPYLQPCIDELLFYLTVQELRQMLDSFIIHAIPLSMMRGRTFNNAFVIMDEGQNASKDEIKMILTRLGVESKIVIAGDPAQTDLSVWDGGFNEAINRLRGVRDVSISSFGYSDIVRHGVVAEILKYLW